MSALLTVDQTLNLVRIPRRTYYAMRSDGRFPTPVRIGQREVAHLRSDIDAWLAANRPSQATNAA